MRSFPCLTAAMLGAALLTGAGATRAATFNAPGLTAPVRDGPGLPVGGCGDRHAPETARTAFLRSGAGVCCRAQEGACAEFLSTTRLQRPRRAART